MSRLYPFTYFGSQYRSFPFIRDRLPQTDYYIEPFGGSGVVLLNLEPTHFEVYNDYNGLVVDFFDCLRNKTDELISSLELTPYHRHEYERAVEKKDGDLDSLDKLERARVFFVLAQQGRYSRSIDSRTKGEWRRSIQQIRGGHSSKVNEYRNKIDQLSEVSARLECVQIENRDALKVIEEYDQEEAVFYIDPPYIPEVRENSDGAYGEFDWGVEKHEELGEILNSCSGYVAISGYKNNLYGNIYEDWNIYLDEEKANQNGSTGSSEETSYTQEALWTNYDAESVGRGFTDDVESALSW